jgi:hypothetical protein
MLDTNHCRRARRRCPAGAQVILVTSITRLVRDPFESCSAGSGTDCKPSVLIGIRATCVMGLAHDEGNLKNLYFSSALPVGRSWRTRRMAGATNEGGQTGD